MNDQKAEYCVWWFEGFWQEDACRAPVAPYADYGEEPFRNLGRLSKDLRQRQVESTPDDGSNSPCVSAHQRGNNRVFDDLGRMTISGILMSGAMIGLSAEFDLGEPQAIELPMYEGLGQPMAQSCWLEEPDFSRPVPGRWGPLHARETNDAIIEKACKNVGRGLVSMRRLTKMLKKNTSHNGREDGIRGTRRNV